LIRVSDTGTGMDATTLQRAMEPFFTTKDPDEGTGLGLAVVHGIVSAHGGTVHIDSRPGEGTIVSVTLPLSAIPDERQEPVADMDTGSPEPGGGTVFLAEGHSYVRDILATALEDSGFTVSPVTSCPEFRALHRDGAITPDLIVLDADLPGGCGVDCLEKIRRHGYAGPAILVTHDLTEDMEDRLDADVMVLRKPLRVGELRRLATAMTRGRRSGGAAA